MPDEHAGFPVAVAGVLPPKIGERAAGEIRRTNRRVEPDLSSGLTNPVVELVVLIRKEAFVEGPDALHPLAPKAAEGHGVDRSCVPPNAVARIAGAQRMGRSPSDRLGDPTRPLRADIP